MQAATSDETYYQLTHDYLVPSVREWLIQKRLALYPNYVRTVALRPPNTPYEHSAVSLMSRLIDTGIAQVPGIVAEMQDYRRWTDPLLRAAYAEAETTGNRQRQLHTSLALLPVDHSQVEYLFGRLLNAEPHEVAVIREPCFLTRNALSSDFGPCWNSPKRGEKASPCGRRRSGDV